MTPRKSHSTPSRVRSTPNLQTTLKRPRHPLAESSTIESPSVSSRKHRIDHKNPTQTPTATPISGRSKSVTASRKKSKNSKENIENDVVEKNAEAEETVILPNGDEEQVDEKMEKELEAWQDFAAEHYEMVEQLPLELHRNFRLLRELDDGSLAQTDKLHALLRSYMVQRLAAISSSSGPVETVEINTSQPPEIAVPGDDENAEPAATDTTLEIPKNTNSPSHTQPAQADSMEEIPEETVPEAVPEIEGDEGSGRAEAMGVPIPDGDGGLVLPPLEVEASGADEGRKEFPPRPTEVEDAESNIQTSDDEPIETVEGFVDLSTPPLEDEAPPQTSEANVEPASSNAVPEPTLTPTPIPKSSSVNNARRSSAKSEIHLLLPEIARLAREIVRNGEEKVAVAVGAYNAIDRHIRSLDSALQTHEASILLGLRPATHPSSALDPSQNVSGDVVVSAGEEDGEVVIGVGGGGRRGRNKKGKKGKKAVDEVPVGGVGDGIGVGIEATFDMEVDPNEPRYCYCNQVSYGQMIGCENEECPLEWFHLACCGLETSPTGKWWCQVCKPTGGAAGKDGKGSISATASAAAGRAGGEKKKARGSVVFSGGRKKR